MRVSQSKRGRPKGRCYSASYLAVLEKIAQEGFQSYPELRNSVLQNMTRQNSWKVLKKLTHDEFVTPSRGDGGAILGWSLAPKGKNYLLEKGIQSNHLDSRHPTYKTSYVHDITLREVKNILTQSQRVSSWIPEHVIKAEAMRKFQFLNDNEKSSQLLTIPDGLFKFKAGGKVFTGALELEMTRKSKRRIRQKLESHMTHSDFDFAFFVVNGGPLLQVLWSIYNDVLLNSVETKFHNRLNGIYFTLLDNLRKHGPKATFAGKEDSFSFA